MKYRTKPVEPEVVEAFQWQAGRLDEFFKWLGPAAARWDCDLHTDAVWFNGDRSCEVAYPGYWIVRRPCGAFEVFGPDKFAATYEPETKEQAKMDDTQKQELDRIVRELLNAQSYDNPEDGPECPICYCKHSESYRKGTEFQHDPDCALMSAVRLLKKYRASNPGSPR